MKSAEGRMNIAKTRLAVFGDPEPGEPSETTIMREHYQKMLDDALAEISEAQHAGLPYKDDD